MVAANRADTAAGRGLERGDRGDYVHDWEEPPLTPVRGRDMVKSRIPRANVSAVSSEL